MLTFYQSYKIFFNIWKKELFKISLKNLKEIFKKKIKSVLCNSIFLLINYNSTNFCSEGKLYKNFLNFQTFFLRFSYKKKYKENHFFTFFNNEY